MRKLQNLALWLILLATIAGTKANPMIKREETIYQGTGIEIELQTDGGKLNWLNHQRNPQNMTIWPNSFGLHKRWPPILIIRTDQETKYTIEFERTLTEGILYPRTETGFYLSEAPTKNKAGQKVSLKITVGGEEKTFQTQWSGEREWFLHKNRIEDLAALVEHKNRQQSIEEIWRTATKLNIQYTNGEKKDGYQRIRSIAEIIEEQKATCLDMALWLASGQTDTKLQLSEDHAWIRSEEEELDPTWALKTKEKQAIKWEDRKTLHTQATARKEIDLNEWGKAYTKSED